MTAAQNSWRPEMTRFFRRLRSDRGSSLIESVVSLGIMSLVLMGLAAGYSNSLKIQRSAVGHAMALETAAGAVETIRGKSWNTASTKTTPESALLPAGAEAVVSASGQESSFSREVRGIPLTVSTAVYWAPKPGGGTFKPASGGLFGVKTVTVKVSWPDPSGPGGTRTITQTSTITPPISEAAPNGVREAT